MKNIKKPKKKSWIVSTREVHISMVTILAVDAEDAIERVAHGEGELLDGGFEFSHTLDPETWTAEEGENCI